MKKLLKLFFVMLNISSYAIAGEKKDWIFITEMQGKEKQDSQFWHITSDHKFEIAGNEYTPVLYTETFNDMIQEAKAKNMPFFLILLTSKGKDSKGNDIDILNVYEGKEAFKFLIEKWKTTQYHANKGGAKPYAYFQDPLSNLEVTNITIFVMGDNGQFTKLKELKSDSLNDNYLSNFVVEAKKPVEDFPTQKIEYNYKVKDILNKKGEAQLFIAELFKQNAELHLNTAEIQALQSKIQNLKNEASHASDIRVREIIIEIEQLQNQIEELQRKNLTQESKRDLQHAMEWYDWALKYLPSNQQAEVLSKKAEVSAILTEKPKEPEKPKVPDVPKKPDTPQEPDQKLLLQNFHNLIRSLHQISIFLT